MRIADKVLEVLSVDPSLNNDELSVIINDSMPGKSTTAASVASIKSKLKRDGQLKDPNTPYRPAKKFELGLPEETLEQKSLRIKGQYAALERIADKVAKGQVPAMVVSGPPGLGKTYTVMQTMRKNFLVDYSDYSPDLGDARPYDCISGSITTAGLYEALWNLKDGGVLILDDCDDVFRDEASLNLLKAVIDSSDERWVSYRKQAGWLSELGIPTSFKFEGSVIFCTNIDFELAILKGSTQSKHFEALIDRSLYVALNMRTKADYLVRIKHVVIDGGMLQKAGLNADQALEVYEFIEANAEKFYGLSLRLAHHIGICYLSDPENWQSDIKATKMKSI